MFSCEKDDRLAVGYVNPNYTSDMVDMRSTTWYVFSLERRHI